MAVLAVLAVLALPVPNCGPNLMFSVVHFLKARRRKIPATTQGQLNSWGWPQQLATCTWDTIRPEDPDQGHLKAILKSNLEIQCGSMNGLKF